MFSMNAEVYGKKIQKEFDIVLPVGANPKSTYEHLLHERELFLLYNLCLTMTMSNDGYINPLRTCFLPWIFNQNLDAFRKSVEKECSVEMKSASTVKEKSAKIFFDLLHDKTDDIHYNKKALMLELCRINAHQTIKLIYQLYPGEIDLSELLKEAISCLHVETVEALLDMGADLHKPIKHSDYSDYGYQLFVSPLYYALLLPQESYSVLGRMFGPCLSCDNPRLTAMLNFLLSRGARPEQYCIATNPTAHNIESSVEQKEVEENCIVAAKSILSGHREKGVALNQSYLDLLERLADWTPAKTNESNVRLVN